MIILIAGESHVGKTLMAQKLLERYKFPYLSLDHIKMGLVRGYENCGFTPLDDDEVIGEKMWPIVKGIITTCSENNQNIIIEGCYLPPHRVKEILGDSIIGVYIVFSKEYIESNFDKIMEFENVIESRKFKDDRSEEEYIKSNTLLKKRCNEEGVDFFEIKRDYEREIEKVYRYIEEKVAENEHR